MAKQGLKYIYPFQIKKKNVDSSCADPENCRRFQREVNFCDLKSQCKWVYL